MLLENILLLSTERPNGLVLALFDRRATSRGGTSERITAS
jgi:hypothetical protein